MTISLRAEHLGLIYRVPLRSPLRRNARPHVGGRVVQRGNHQYITALEDVSFELRAGDRLGLVGANGAGKTTLLKVLYGIYPPSQGRVAAEGRIDAPSSRLPVWVIPTDEERIIARHTAALLGTAGASEAETIEVEVPGPALHG